MTKRMKKVKALLAVACAGSFLLQAGACASQDLRIQFANGLKTAINGVFGVATATFANEVFDVND